MSSEPGAAARTESVARCHQLHPDSRERFIQCLCENVAGLCRAPPPQAPPPAVTATTPPVTTALTPTGPTSTGSPLVPTDWTRSYSVTAGLCALFLAMCAVIIVLRIMSKRNEPQTRGRVSVSTVPVPDSDPPPYEVVVRLPPSYISREPPPYCEIDIDKYPSPLICPRQLSNSRPTAEASSTGMAASSRDTSQEPAGSGQQTAGSGQEAASCGQQTASRGQEAASCGQQTASCGQEVASCGQEAASRGQEAEASCREVASRDQEASGEESTTSRVAESGDSGASDAGPAGPSSAAGESRCTAEVTVVSEVRDARTSPVSGGESSSL